MDITYSASTSTYIDGTRYIEVVMHVGGADTGVMIWFATIEKTKQLMGVLEAALAVADRARGRS